jgi:hypothetical protein
MPSVSTRCASLAAVPKGVASAVCEMARKLLPVDRTAAPPGEGISSQQSSESSHDAAGGTRSQMVHVFTNTVVVTNTLSLLAVEHLSKPFP